jgi:hypothetical protein
MSTDYQSLLDNLERYHEDHIYFWRCLFDFFGIANKMIKNKLKDPTYVGKLCLDICMMLNFTTDEEWTKFLKKHHYNDHMFFNSCGHLSIIISNIRNLRISESEETNYMLKNAVELLNNSDLYIKSRRRIHDLQKYGSI